MLDGAGGWRYSRAGRLGEGGAAGGKGEPPQRRQSRYAGQSDRGAHGSGRGPPGRGCGAEGHSLRGPQREVAGTWARAEDLGAVHVPEAERRSPGDPKLKYLAPIVACAPELAT